MDKSILVRREVWDGMWDRGKFGMECGTGGSLKWKVEVKWDSIKEAGRGKQEFEMENKQEGRGVEGNKKGK